MTTLGVRDLVPRRAPSAVAVRSLVDLAEIRFGFNDHPRYPTTARVRHDEQLPEQLARYPQSVGPCKKILFESHSRQMSMERVLHNQGCSIKTIGSVRKTYEICLRVYQRAAEVEICLSAK